MLDLFQKFAKVAVSGGLTGIRRIKTQFYTHNLHTHKNEKVPLHRLWRSH